MADYKLISRRLVVSWLTINKSPTIIISWLGVTTRAELSEYKSPTRVICGLGSITRAVTWLTIN